jgi:hypothetical protein
LLCSCVPLFSSQLPRLSFDSTRLGQSCPSACIDHWSSSIIHYRLAATQHTHARQQQLWSAAAERRSQVWFARSSALPDVVAGFINSPCDMQTYGQDTGHRTQDTRHRTQDTGQGVTSELVMVAASQSVVQSSSYPVVHFVCPSV